MLPCQVSSGGDGFSTENGRSLVEIEGTKRWGRLGNVKSARGKARYVFNSRACLSPEINRFSQTNSATNRTNTTWRKSKPSIESLATESKQSFSSFQGTHAAAYVLVYVRFSSLRFPVYLIHGRTYFSLILQLIHSRLDFCSVKKFLYHVKQLYVVFNLSILFPSSCLYRSK